MYKLFSRILTLLLVILLGYVVVDFLRFPLAYDSVGAYQLKQDVEKGNPFSTNYYRTLYVNQGKYLFNGPITFNLICQKNDVEQPKCDELYKQFKVSKYSLVSFEKRFIRRQ
jgi:hypothetical protein